MNWMCDKLGIPRKNPGVGTREYIKVALINSENERSYFKTSTNFDFLFFFAKILFQTRRMKTLRVSTCIYRSRRTNL